MRRVLTLAGIALWLGLGAALAGEFSPIGQWEVTSGESRYRVSYCNGTELCAMLTWLREDARTEENVALLNRYVVRGAKPGGDNTWTGTLMYGGERYAGRVKMMSQNAMRFESCSGMLCRTFTLHRL